MLSHSIDWSTAVGVFGAMMGALTCGLFAFGNRRLYPYAPHWLVLAYRVAWLTVATAWAAQALEMIVSFDNSSLRLASAVVTLTGTLLGLYFMIQLRRCWPFAIR